MQLLKQSTAATLKIGPFLDDTDGKTAETALTIAQADVRLSKNGGNIAQKNEATSCTHDELGIYGCPINTTDTGTLGRLQLWVHESGALPAWHEFMVVTANVYDTLCSTDTLQADLTQIGGTAQSATDLKDFADAGYDPATNKVQGVVLADTCTTNTDMVGTNSAALASVCTETRLAELDTANLPTDVSNVKTDTAAILIDTAEIGTAGAGLTDLGGMSLAMKGEVNTEVADVITTDTSTEPAQGAPPATPTLEEMIKYLYFKMRNKTETTSAEDAMYDNAGSTKVMKAAISDNGTTFTKEEYGTGA